MIGLFYMVCNIAAWPLLIFMLYRNFRFHDSLMSKREDFGFALLLGSVASIIWPFGLFLIICITGFGEGIFSEKVKH